MMARLPGPLTSGIKSRYGNPLIFIGSLIVLALIGWGLYVHFHNASGSKSGNQNVNAGTDLSTNQLLNIKSSTIRNSLNKKDYSMATDSCLGASSDAYNLKEYNQSKSLLEECIQAVPDKDVPWYIYSALAETAEKLNDNTLAKSSWQTAIQKAKLPNSGADQATISVMQKDMLAVE